MDFDGSLGHTPLLKQTHAGSGVSSINRWESINFYCSSLRGLLAGQHLCWVSKMLQSTYFAVLITGVAAAAAAFPGCPGPAAFAGSPPPPGRRHTPCLPQANSYLWLGQQKRTLRETGSIERNRLCSMFSACWHKRFQQGKDTGKDNETAPSMCG